MTLDELIEGLEEAFPDHDFSVEEDDNGEVIIHTGLKNDGDDNLIPMDDEDFDGDDD